MAESRLRLARPLLTNRAFSQDRSVLFVRRTAYRHSRPAVQLLSWVLVVLMVVVPSLASAGGRAGRTRAKKSKPRVNKLKTLRARSKAPTARKRRARANRRGSKLANRLRLRTLAGKAKRPAQLRVLS